MSEIICHCFEVSREEIENAIREKGLKTVEEVGEVTNAGTGCGGCQEQIQEILDEINGNNLPSSNNKRSRIMNFHRNLSVIVALNNF